MRYQPLLNTRFFFSTTPMPCPYLPNRMERRVVTELIGRDPVTLHEQLSFVGFINHNMDFLSTSRLYPGGSAIFFTLGR